MKTPGEIDAVAAAGGVVATILATLRLRQLKLADSAVAIESALTRLRTDPWPAARVAQRALQVAADAEPGQRAQPGGR